jgi:hypothetical protein
MKICPMGAELFQADGRTDMKLMVAFRNSANAQKKEVMAAEGKKVACRIMVGRGMNVAAVGHHYGEHVSKINSIKKNYDQWKQ